MATPGAEQQARFLKDLQLLLAEGEFVSTYKYALLLALVRWAIEHPQHPEGQPVDAAVLAPHFVELYWGHALPFHTDVASDEARAVAEPVSKWPSTRDLLVQDRGRQDPRILGLIRDAHRQCGHVLRVLDARDHRTLLRKVTQTITAMPLWKLQTVRTRTEPHAFLYRPGGKRSQFFLQPGALGCLIAFAPLIQDTVRGAWLRFVLRYNKRLLSPADQVESFLFPDGRAGLDAWRPLLLEMQGRRCFYCRSDVRGTGAVDHFLPWARYPRDLGHNFVFAHSGCNMAKSDHLAATGHLAAWCQRNATHGGELASAFDRAGLPHDWPVLWNVATSLYGSAADQGSDVWNKEQKFDRLDPEWRAILEAHRPTLGSRHPSLT